MDCKNIGDGTVNPFADTLQQRTMDVASHVSLCDTREWRRVLLRACSVMIPKGKSVVLAFVSFQLTDARRAPWPAFLVQVPARRSQSANGDTPTHCCRPRPARQQCTPLFSAAEKAENTQQVRHRV